MQSAPNGSETQRCTLDPRYEIRASVQAPTVVFVEKFLQSPYQAFGLKAGRVDRSHDLHLEITGNGEIEVSWDFQVPGIQRDVHEIGHDCEPDVEFAGIPEIGVAEIEGEGIWA